MLPLLAALALLTLSAPASASGMSFQFVTYDGYQETMDAFTRLALIFSDHVFLGFFSIFACGAVAAGLMVKSTQMQMGQEANPIGWLIPILAGGVIVQGLVLPTGTMYVYDPVLNATGSIGGVPDIVLIVAGGLNELEQDIVQVVDTASGTAYGTTGGTMPFTLLHASQIASPSTSNLSRSVAQYFSDCGTFAIAVNQQSGSGSVTLDELVNTSTDLYSTFAKFQNPTVQTVYYPITTDANYPSDNGLPMSCTQAWTQLGPNLNSMNAFKSMENTICTNAGFDTKNAVQLGQCDADLTSLVSSTLGVSSGNSLTFMRSILLGQSIVTAMQSADFNMAQSQIMNRQIMTESLGSAQAMAEWIPKMRAFLTAAILGMFPLLALFMVTPLVWKALGMFVGMLAFLFFWGVFDAVAVQMANDAAVHALAQVLQNNLAFDAIINMPEGAIKALGIFGKARGVGFAMAGACAGTLLSFGGAAISQIGGSFINDAERKGEDGARKEILPEERGGYIQNMVTGAATESVVRQYGYTNAVAGQARSMEQGASWAREMNVNSSLTGGASSAAGRVGALDAANDQGRVSAINDATGQTNDIDKMFAGQFANTRFSAAAGFGRAEGEKAVADANGVSAPDYGHWQGGIAAGGTMADREASKRLNVTPEFSGENLTNLGWQKNTQLFGQIDAEKGPTAKDKVHQDTTARTQFAEKQLAEGGYYAQHPGSADVAGAGSAIQSTAHGKGVIDAAHDVGVDGLAKGDQYRQEHHAEEGIAAAELDGGIKATATTVGRVQIAGQVANANVVRSLATVLGEDPKNIRGLVAARTEQGRTNMTVPLTSDTKGRLIDYAEQHGMIEKKYAEELRHDGNSGAASVTMNDHGDVESIRFDAGNTVSVRHSASIDNSKTQDNSDTFRTNIGPSGDIGGLSDENMAVELGRVYKGAGYEKDDNEYRSFVKGLATALTQMGANGEIRDIHNSSVSTSAGVSGSVGAGIPGTRVGGGVDIGGRKTSDWQTGNTSSFNANILLAEKIANEAREHAINAAWIQNGPGLMRNEGRSSEAQAAVNRIQGQLIADQLKQYADHSQEHSAPEFLNHNKVGEEYAHDEDVRNTPPPEVIQQRESDRLRAEPKV